MSAAGTNLGEIRLQGLDRLVHLLFGGFLDVNDCHAALLFYNVYYAIYT
jgi:hypothetical protein